MSSLDKETKFAVKYFMMAREVGTRFNPCFSRQIGIVLVNPITNSVISTGYNGPPTDTPHCNTREFLSEFFWPQLTQQEKYLACENVESYTKDGCNITKGIRVLPEFKSEGEMLNYFLKHSAGKSVCPRRYVNAGPGERSTLCSCAHAERNALLKAEGTKHGSIMFCWCGVPCMDCASAIVQSGVKKVYCLEQKSDYFTWSRWLFAKRGVQLEEYSEDFVLTKAGE